MGRDELSRLRRAGEVLAVERAGEVRYPGFHFADGRPRSVIAQLAALRLRHNASETDVIFWLFSPTTYFHYERRPLRSVFERTVCLVCRA